MIELSTIIYSILKQRVYPEDKIWRICTFVDFVTFPCTVFISEKKSREMARGQEDMLRYPHFTRFVDNPLLTLHAV